MKYQLNPKQEEWVLALESRKFKQGRLALHARVADASDRYCCLGVACSLFAAAFPDQIKVEAPNTAYADYFYDGEDTGLPAVVVRHLGMLGSAGPICGGPRLQGYTSLAMANDARVPFTKIAEFIRAYPETVFDVTTLIKNE